MAVAAYSMGARLHLRVSDVQKSEQDFITLLEVVGREVKVLILFLIKEAKIFSWFAHSLLFELSR